MDNQENNSFVRDDLPETVEIIGISFRGSTKIYYFAANGAVAKEGDNAIVETARGLEYGKVSLTNTHVKREELVLPLKNVIRIADKNDDMRYEANREKEAEAFDICVQKIADHKLDMKLIDVEYTFDNSKLLFYFTSDDRVDFRDLVKDLAGYFRTRIELRQIGIRDEAKIMGGLGICGRPFCCSTFLPDFVQVSIKMAKEQNLSLNSAKISGACGRLMCCLRYEYDTYQEEMRRMPRVDSTVVTPDGVGVVTEVKPLENTVKVRLEDENEKQPKLYHLSVLKPYDKNATVQTFVPKEAHPSDNASKDGARTADKGRADRNDRRTQGAQTKKKDDASNRETRENRMQDKAALHAEEVVRDVQEAAGEQSAPEKRDGQKGGKGNRNNRNRNRNRTGDRGDRGDNRETAPKGANGQNAAEKPVSSEQDKAVKREAASREERTEQQNRTDKGANNRNRNRNNRNRHQGERHRPEDASKPNQQSEQNANRKPQNNVAQNPQPQGAASNEGGNSGRKEYAPMPSNSVKKGNRGRFGQIRTKAGSAFQTVPSNEKKDNSEKK